MLVQRTRSSPSAPHSPLTRHPLGATDWQRRIRAGLMLLLACLVTSVRCSYGKSVPVTVSGQRFPCRDSQSLGKGVTPSDARTLLGEPLEITSEGAVEAWRYFDKERYGDHIYLLGFIPISQPHYFGSCETVLRFQDGTLYSVTSAWEESGPEGRSAGGPVTRQVR